jgi:23S rRNA pseudouridine2605 synthase
MAGHGGHPNERGGEGQGAPPPAGERVAKALARAGVASRRQIERLIAEGRVAVNGQVLTSPAVKVNAADTLTVDGKAVAAAEPTRLFRYHKPAGLVTTHRDPQGRRTVFDALPQGLPRLISVGRLDLTSEGLLLLTNDGGLARALELPSGGWRRLYRARARGRVDQERLDRLRDGVTVDAIRYGPIEATLDATRAAAPGANLWLTLTLAEGKNREVRKVLESLGLTVNRLIRLAYGPFRLDALAPGEIEEVAPAIIRAHFPDAIAPADSSVTARAEPPPAGPDGRRGSPKKQAYGAGWARPKGRRRFTGPGSAPAVARSSDPPGPKRSSSPRRSSPARRRDPRRGDDRGPGA